MKPYSDLGKDASDLLNKDYVLGCFQFSHKGKVEGIELNTNANVQTKSNATSSSVETKFKYPKYGLSLAETWNSKNLLKSDLCIENYFYKGLKQNAIFSYNIESGAQDFSLKNAFKHDQFHAALHLNSPQTKKDVSHSLVVGSNGYLLGADLALDGNNMKLSNANLALGYETRDFSAFCFLENKSKNMRASFHQSINAQ
ncbi:hypothetical protein Ciccas_011902, partial [Cichlidogyrus casuarinus]